MDVSTAYLACDAQPRFKYNPVVIMIAAVTRSLSLVDGWCNGYTCQFGPAVQRGQATDGPTQSTRRTHVILNGNDRNGFEPSIMRQTGLVPPCSML